MKQNIGCYTLNYTKVIHNIAQIWNSFVLNFRNNKVPKSVCLKLYVYGKWKLIME